MSENLVIKLAFPDKNGKKLPVELSMPAARKLISELLTIAVSLPQPANIQTEIASDPNPIHATAFAISPIDDDPHSARVSIGAGAIDVQFSVPLAPLFEALKVLKAQ